MKILIVVLFLIVSQFLVAQNKTASIKLSKGETIQYFQDFGQNGFCIKTGSKNSNWKIKYYSNDLKLIWDKDLVKECLYQPAAYTFPIVGSKDGSVIYFIQNLYGLSLKSGRTHVTQIRKTGEVKTRMLDTKKLVKNNLAMFCDDNNLYVLDGESVGLGDYKKYDKLQWNLISISHEELKIKEVPLQLPALGRDRLAHSSWMFGGVVQHELYLYSNNFNDSFNTNQVVIGKVNLVSGKTTIQNVELKIEHMFLGNHTNNRIDGGYIEPNIGDYYYFGESSFKQTGNMYTKMQVSEKGEFYFYGSTGEGKKTHYEGYFVCKFDQNSELSWKVENSHETIKAKNKFLPGERRITSDVDLLFKNGEINLVLCTRDYDDVLTNLFVEIDVNTGEEKKVAVGRYKTPNWLKNYQLRRKIAYSRNVAFKKMVATHSATKKDDMFIYTTKNNDSFFIYLNRKLSTVKVYKY